MKGYLFDIKHFAVHDGPGIRTTVFFKGCPLKCIWCHNPESISRNRQLGYIEHKCVNCGRCAAVCPNGAHTMTENHIHSFDREKCTACGKCAEACYLNNLILYGKDRDVEVVLEEVLEDRDFYDTSNGGVTLSGGECLTQASFCAELLKRVKAEGIHTAVDTCGFVSREAFNQVIPYTDLFLYDMKAYDEEVHKKCTGQSNQIILENLKYLDETGCKIEIRIPFVPEYNGDQIAKIGRFLSGLHNIVGVRILPYHNFAGTKYRSLDMRNTLPDRLPDGKELDRAKKILTELQIKVLE